VDGRKCLKEQAIVPLAVGYIIPNERLEVTTGGCAALYPILSLYKATERLRPLTCSFLFL